ncbi:Scoloptoxin SSD976-like [Homarus americanus]|uniref:Scoloptoxin SSD976-like n=1 Tax=Homarus americanus TaxID=6706 RepID=A0A8J5K6B0_HOMAM|nr:Scoloptoxin SSD976-like [Homarus americanus]
MAALQPTVLVKLLLLFFVFLFQGTTNYCTTTLPPSATIFRTTTCDYKAFNPAHTMTLGVNSKCNISWTGITDEERQEILDAHNTLRAKAWASQCRRGHDGYPKRKICSRNYVVGQNIFYQWTVKSWYNEVSYMPNTYVSTFNAVPPSNKVITHYSQVVWAKTYEVGCGAVYYTTMFRGKTYTQSKIYVCNYGPAANYRNRPVYLEGVPASQCPNTPSEVYIGLCN